jgi:hypothetical protein
MSLIEVRVSFEFQELKKRWDLKLSSFQGLEEMIWNKFSKRLEISRLKIFTRLR